MAKMKGTISWLAVTCLLTAAAWADEPQAAVDAEALTVLVGERVRLSAPPYASSDHPLIGQVVAVDAEAVTVAKDKRTGDIRRIPVWSIKRLDVARPEWRSQAGTGASIGLALPVTAALVVLAAPCRGGDCGLGQLGVVLALARVAPACVLAGAVIGSQIHTYGDRWERVPIRHVQVSVLPDLRGGIRGGVTIRF